MLKEEIPQMTIYMEGGGDGSRLKGDLRKAVEEMLIKAGLTGHMPRIVACGGRKNTFDKFCVNLALGNESILLIDSEDLVDGNYQKGNSNNWDPWGHLAHRKGDMWVKPINATSNDCHLMVPCMESMYLADVDSLVVFFGQGFKANSLPQNPNIESIGKVELFKALSNASRGCSNKTKSMYSKGAHSPVLISMIDSRKVAKKMPWMKRFFNELLMRANLPLIA
jgi:hypothetical protein